MAFDQDFNCCVTGKAYTIEKKSHFETRQNMYTISFANPSKHSAQWLKGYQYQRFSKKSTLGS